jgi:hypothetical protein
MAFRRFLFILGAAMACAQSGMTTFQHPSGVSMSYPQDWRLDRKDETIFLTPNDAGDGETIVLGGEEAEGVTSVRDARVVRFFEQSITKAVPQLRRVGEVRAADTALGPGITFSFAGRNSAGHEVEADVYVTLHQGTGIYLAHLAPPAWVGKRRPVIQQVFASLHKSARHIDPALVGTWEKSDYRRTDSSGALGRSGTLSRTAYTYFVFLDDGRFAFIQTSSLSGNTANLGVIASSKSADAERGTWFTASGKLNLAFENGDSAVFSYKVERGVPTVLELITSKGASTLFRLLTH